MALILDGSLKALLFLALDIFKICKSYSHMLFAYRHRLPPDLRDMLASTGLVDSTG